MKSGYLFFIFCSILTFAQNDFKPSTDIIPPSIENYFFTKYGDIKVNNNQGAFSYNIPIHNINSGNINLDLNLAYYTSGIKVNDISGNVGLGWNLNAGGMITRIVRGLPDEELDNITFRPLKENLKISLNGNYDEVEYRNKYLNDYINIYSANGFNGSPSNIDTQQDLFNYNFNGYSGTFYIEKNEIFISDPNLKATFTRVNSNGNFYLLFNFITPDGNKYIFGGDSNYVESSRLTTDCSKNFTKNPDSTWYLKEISDINNNKINFDYENSYKSYPLDYYQTYTITYNVTNNLPNSILSKNNSNCTTFFNSNNAKLLKTITFKNGSVNFSYSYRLDYTTGKKLDSFVIKDNLNDSIPITFNYIYSGNTDNNKRLFLNTILIKDNLHRFEYSNINNLPNRLSNSQDFYGYANDNTSNTITNFNLQDNPNKTNFINSFGNLNADKSVSDKSLYGLLIKIIYPTKGYTLINYENHKSETSVPTTFYSSNSLNVEYHNCEAQYYNEVDVKSFEFVSNGTPIHFSAFMSTENCPDVYTDDARDIYKISIEDLSTGQSKVNFQGNKNKPYKTNNGSEVNGQYIISPVNTINGNKYKITLSTSSRFNNTRAYISFNYNSYLGTISEQKNYSGARVKSIINNNGDTFENEKIYYYNDLNNINNNKTSLISDYYYSNWNCQPTSVATNNNHSITSFNCQTINFSTNNSLDFLNSNTERIRYKFITEKSNNGYIENEYSISSITDDSQQLLQNPINYRNKSNNNWDENNLLKTKTFSNELFLKRETKNTYEITKSKKFDNYNIEHGLIPVDPAVLLYTNKYTYVMNQCISLYCNVQGKVAINHYYNYILNKILSKTTTTEYFENSTSPVTTEINYNYDSPNHLQVTKQTTTNSKGETITTEYQYPPDLVGQRPFADILTTQNRIAEPMITTKRNGEQVISSVYTEYNDFNGIIQKSRVFQKKGSSSIVEGDDVIAYNSYDAFGNITQYTPKNGSSVSIIWGYNGQYPVAKIEGDTYANSITKIGSLLTKLQNGTLTPSEENSIRGLFPDAMITTYKYKPLIGVTSITGPNGLTEIYEYDSAGRLEVIRNHKNEILKTFKYNYKN